MQHPAWCTHIDCEFAEATGAEGYHLGPRSVLSPAPGGSPVGVRLSQLVDETRPPVGVRLRMVNQTLGEAPRITVGDLSPGEARAVAALLVDHAARAEYLGGVR